ncbi:MAG TPA: F0F1 ATP synthase subunit A [Streptosporangiaceae bacterium]|nr:F0F1 ATP synthase subunit A [Streptosporangiaceae bacterium]
MSDIAVMMPASGCHIFTGCGYPAPSINDFYFQPIFSIGSFHFTKPMLLALVSAAIILTFFFVAFRKPKIVPRGAQNLGEVGVLFVRDQILRPQLGSKGDKYLPFLVSIFFFVWIMNLFGIIPLVEFPATSRIAFPAALAFIVWVTYIVIGMRSKGPIGYFRTMAIPQGAPWWILPLLTPIELFSNILVRPFTLAIRLFANMLAGHLLLLVFGLASWYLFSASIGLLYATTSFVLTIILTGLEVLIQALQAFIFATLTAFYIADATETAH